MKVIKRDGRVVDYDKSKISIAIEKANNEVIEKEKKANKEDIKAITNYIEKIDKKRILVEDIQDIIEQKLMELGKYELAKKYIVYRYTRALVRKSNTTDESILGLIRNESNENVNQNMVLASVQRDYIAGEVSKDLTKRLLLPEKISKANEEGIIHFHNAEYFVQPIFNCCLINIEDMLENGTSINGILIETPKSFQVACIVITQIIGTIASNQYGEESIDLKILGKYLRKSKEKFEKELEKEFGEQIDKETKKKLVEIRLKGELKSGIQAITYQLNTFMTTNIRPPYITFFLNLFSDYEYIEENAMIIEEILKQRIQGIKNNEGLYVMPELPKLIYVLDELNCMQGGKYDYLTQLALKCSNKNMYFMSAKKMRENYDNNVFSPMGYSNFLIPWKNKKGEYKFEGRFNQGIVSINLPQIAICSEKDENEFWKILEERLEMCKEALMCRHYSLLGTTSNISPIHWQNGAISRLKKNEKIDEFLYGGYSTISLGYIGIYEMTEFMKEGASMEEAKRFCLNVLKYLREKVNKWRKETNIGFTLYSYLDNDVSEKFAKIDKEKYGTIKNITDKGYYTNSYYMKASKDIYENLKMKNEFIELSSGGAILNVEISKDENINELIKFIYENIQCLEILKK